MATIQAKIVEVNYHESQHGESPEYLSFTAHQFSDGNVLVLDPNNYDYFSDVNDAVPGLGILDSVSDTGKTLEYEPIELARIASDHVKAFSYCDSVKSIWSLIKNAK